MFRTAILGCGGRAKGHARAYEHVTKGELVAICDLDETRRNAFGEEFGVAARYDSFAKMVEQEQPDLVHIVTLPGVRVELLTQAVELGVPAVIVEKPLAVDLDDLSQIAELDGRGTKLCVNHQLRFHAPFCTLLDDVLSGRIGPVRFIDGSAFSRIFEQGSHVLNLMFSLNRHSPPVMVHGGCGGAVGLGTGHPSPDTSWGILTFENGVRASFVFGDGVPLSPDPNKWQQKRVAAYGEAGHIEWWMNHYSKQLFGAGPEHGTHVYRDQDNPAQGRLTDAMLTWLEDEHQPHPTRLEVSLLEAYTLAATYLSVLEQRPVALPLETTDALLPRLREMLHEAE